MMSGLEGNAGLSTRTLQVPIDRDFVAGDDTAPVGAEQDVVDGGSAGLHTGAGKWLAGLGIEHEGNDPWRDVVAALAATPVERAGLGEAVTDLDAVDAQEVLDDVHEIIRQHNAFHPAAGEDRRVRSEDIAHAAVETRLGDVVHQVVGAEHEDPLAAQLVGDAG